MRTSLSTRTCHFCIQQALLCLLVSALAPNASFAQGFTVVGPETTAAGNERYEFFLDTTGAEGTFDTFELILESNGLFNQVGQPTTPVPFSNPRYFPASEDSGFSALINCFGFDCGPQLGIFGHDASTDTASLVSGTFTSLGSNQASTHGNRLVAQVVMAPGGGGTHSFSFFDDGSQVGISGTGIPFGVPELSTLTLFVHGSVALSSRRRRREEYTK